MRGSLAHAVVVVALVALIYWGPEFFVIEYLIVYLLGAALGFSEVLFRFRDEPWLASPLPPATVYIVLNGFFSMAAYWLIVFLAINFGASEMESNLKTVLQVMTAGLGAMAFLRSGFFIAKFGNSDKDILVGPGFAAQRILDALVDSIRRYRAVARATIASNIAAKVSLNTLVNDVPLFMKQTMQMDEETSNSMKDFISAVSADANVTEHAKKRSIALLLVNVGGEQALLAAVANLSDHPPTSSNPASPPAPNPPPPATP
jgi:hypothetical protein